MKLVVKSVSIVFILTFLAACSNTGPVTIRDVNAPPVVESNEETDTSSGSSVAITTPVAPSTSSSSIPLVEKWVQQADMALSQQQYLQAIELAERGLRIERKEPRFYRVLASAYRSLGNSQQSVSFAKQGLHYAQKRTDVYRQLQALSQL